MKRVIFCLLLAMCMCISAAALANSWGAPGGTINLFDGTEYNDYTVQTDDYLRTDDAARLIVRNRYHQQLWWAEKVDGKWQIAEKSTVAVYQPDSGKIGGGWPKLTRDDGGFALMYENESYWFDADMTLVRARYQGEDGMLMLTYNGTDAYLAEDDGGSAYWQVYGGLKLKDFNISLMPRSVPEAVHMNRMRSMLYEVFTAPMAVTRTDGSKQAVYAAPDKKSYRAAKGKAAAGLSDLEGLTLLGRWNGWDVVEYAVSLRTSRIGYIRGGHIHDGYSWDEEFAWLPAVVTEDSFLTDDPNVSQYVTAKLAKGKNVMLLGSYGRYYAYVETTVDGKNARGFVPLRSLALQRDSAGQAAEHITGGPWYIWAGGNMLPDGITFRADGTFAVPMEDGSSMTGTWSVRVYDPEEQLFWSEPAYVLQLVYSDGRETVRGLTTTMDGFSLVDGEGGGGYRLQKDETRE